MVAIEAASHGLQTVAFATGGVTDAVREGTSGSLIKPEDYISFAEEVIRQLRVPKKLEATCIDFGKKFCWENFGTSIDSVIQRGQIKGS
jgi:phosphatidylinositol alpha-1,6-mannosyltransferase